MQTIPHEPDIQKTKEQAFDIAKVRKDFPILNVRVHNKPLIYLDNAATAQKPQSVIDSVQKFYSEQNANIHRGVYFLSEVSSHLYEGARSYIQEQINAEKSSEVIFVKGATEGINLVASSFGRTFLEENDEVIVSGMEHHANLVPWQLICKERKAKLRIIPIDEEGNLQMDAFYDLLNERTKFISVVYVSNSIGTVNPVKEIIEAAHKHDIPVLIDGCQAAPHFTIDVQDLDCDFFAFSGHKVFGPTGTGVLYGKEKYLEKMPPYQSGGDMIKAVSYHETTFAELPHKFEAGTPNIAGIIGLAESFRYLNAIGRTAIHQYEHEVLLPYLNKRLESINGLKIIGTAHHKIPVASFVIEGAHPYDIGTMLDFEGVAIRTGNHCTQPLLDVLGVTATCRASLAFYNTTEEIDQFVTALEKVLQKLR